MIPLDTEEWKTVIYDGEIWENYEVSSHGRVRSLNYKRTGQIQILKQNDNEYGYLKIQASKHNHIKVMLVHRMVGFAFIPNDNPTEKTQINHINENKHDNRVENLEWISPKNNCNYGTGQERQKQAQIKTKTEKYGRKVRCIETGVIYDSLKHAERETGLNCGNIQKCCTGERQTCGKCHWEYVD